MNISYLKKINITMICVSDRVGGRTLTLPLKTAKGTDNFDLGGQWVGRLEVVL